jgi:uncharacterized pyridoxamine 5'-phosphate oxidase family protein
MSPTILLYEELKQEFIQEIIKHRIGVLATSESNHVTARTMAIIADGLNIFCFTGINTRKYKQMQANNKVAISINNLQIEGIANFKGHPSDQENARFNLLCKEQSPELYGLFRKFFEDSNSEFRVIEIISRRIAAYVLDPAKMISYLDILNIVTKQATRTYWDKDYDQY